MDIVKKFERTIEENHMIDFGSLACVSGGADSICLLHLLYDYSRRNNKDLICLHLNHSIRGQEADRDMAFVEDLCASLGIKFIGKKLDIIGMAKKEKKSIELVAREQRYRFFNQVASEYAYSIMLAHNRDDRLETLIHNILRGSSLEGLKGIVPVRDNIFRPLLDVDREEIETYLKEKKISYMEDRTNKETIYTRNKIRLELIPYLEENFNFNLKNSLLRLSDLAKEDNDYLKKLAYEQRDKYIVSKDPLIMSLRGYNELVYSIRSRILLDFLGFLEGGDLFPYGQGIDYSLVKRLDDFCLDCQSGKSIDLVKGYYVKKEYDKVYFLKKDFYIQDEAFILGKEIVTIDAFDENLIVNLEYGVFDYDKLKRDFDIDSLVVRKRQEGDYIIPYGFEGKKKIKNLFIDLKIPNHKRDKIGLLAYASEILWVWGIRRSKYAPIDKDTKNVIIFRLTDEYMED